MGDGLDAGPPVRETWGVGYGRVELLGRARELQELRAGIDDALAGRGALWLVCGEPGIGKSRMIEEVARGTDGAVVLWGRCWEAGGAPAYWPWLQILRALIRRPELRGLAGGERAPALTQLLPELARDGDTTMQGVLPPEQARFQLMEAVASLLSDAAGERPLLLLLEDLHAADGSSLALLDFLARQLYTSPVAVLGSFRDAEATREPLLARLTQEARTIPLGRLGASEVRAFLEEAIGQPAGDSLVARVAERTEGNPLFLVELARLLVTQGGAGEPERALAIPGTLRTALHQRLARLSAGGRELLEQAAVVGREVPVNLLRLAFGADPAALAAALDEVCAAALMARLGSAACRFTHIMVREVVHDAIEPERRRSHHLKVAEALERATVGEPAWSEIAHHAFAAGADGLATALDASERAAERDLARLAFEEAIATLERALDALDRAAPSPLRRAHLLLRLGHARLRGGDVDGGRRDCMAAADLARQLGDDDLFAAAALEIGSVFHFGHVQPDLASLLEEALERLDAADSPLRARLMARLAAALQPALDPTAPVDLARRAIAMARRTGDEDALLAVLRAGGSTMVDLVDPRERVLLDRELVALAERRKQPDEALRGQMRLVFDFYELADPAGAAASMAEVRRLAEELNHPAFLWQARALDGLEALTRGRLDEAEQAIEDADELGRASGDPNARAVVLDQRLHLLWLRGDREALLELVPHIGRALGSGAAGLALGTMAEVTWLLLAGRVEQAALRATPELIDILLRLGDRTSLVPLAVLAVARGDRALAARLADLLLPIGDQMTSSGAIGRVWHGPMARGCALALRALGRLDEAVSWQERALELSRALGSPPMEAVDRLGLADLLAVAGDEAGARTHREVAMGLIDAHGLAGLVPQDARAAIAPVAGARSAPRPVTRFALEREGDGWRLACDGETFHLKDLRGLHILAALLARTGNEIHVIDLAGGGDAIADGGDAGELLDRRARDEYRRRLADLEGELADAEESRDLGRTTRARAELEFLEAELARAVGLGGRPRRAGSAAERARVNVQRRLREAIRRIALHSPRLGRHLENAVHTGTYCRYAPE